MPAACAADVADVGGVGAAGAWVVTWTTPGGVGPDGSRAVIQSTRLSAPVRQEGGLSPPLQRRRNEVVDPTRSRPTAGGNGLCWERSCGAASNGSHRSRSGPLRHAGRSIYPDRSRRLLQVI